MAINVNLNKNRQTSWDHVGKWYHELVGQKGHYYHQQVIIPKVLRLLSLSKDSSVLDLACGQGVLARYLPQGVYYQGVDLSPKLIDLAKQTDKNSNHHYSVSDITKPLILTKHDFDSAVIILGLQNISLPEGVFANAYQYLKIGGRFIIVINHPYFRIPRQTSWGIDEKNKIQYRRINRYLTPLKVPIAAHPGKFAKSPITWSFHYSLADYSRFLFKEGFLIATIEEWISDKISIGKTAKMENRAREEFPLFMTITAIKNR